MFCDSNSVIKFANVHYAITSYKDDYLNKCFFVLLFQVKLIISLERYLCFMYIRNHIIMDFKLVYPILTILNRLCVNCVLSVNLRVNKNNTIEYTKHLTFAQQTDFGKQQTTTLTMNFPKECECVCLCNYVRVTQIVQTQLQSQLVSYINQLIEYIC